MVPCMECKYCTGKRQIFLPWTVSFCQTFVSICFSFSQEFVCSIRSQSMLISLVSILQSDSQSDWSICSSVVSPWGTLLPFGDKRKCASEFSTPAFPAHVTFSLAWRIQLSHCCLLKESLAWSEWVWLWDPFLKLTLKKFLTERNNTYQNAECFGWMDFII